MKLRLKRTLFLTHRWFGIAMSVFLLLWFTTGVIMMYVEYPELTEPERVGMLPPLTNQGVGYPLARALSDSPLARRTDRIRLGVVGTRAAYILESNDGRKDLVYADDGTRPDLGAPSLALATVARSGFAGGNLPPRYDTLVEYDQWTVASALDEHRPLHRIQVADPAGTIVYVSSSTGQIVHDTHRAERLWNWLGSTIHWIYPYQLRRNGPLWTNLLTYLSLALCIAVVSGAIVGTLRLRPIRRYRGRNITPYNGVPKWHHVLGITFVFFLSTFSFSGLMSMSPWGLFDSANSLAEQVERFTGGAIDPSALDGFELPDLGNGLREIEWRQIDGRVHAVLSRSAADRSVLTWAAAGAARAAGAAPAVGAAATFDQSALAQLASRVEAAAPAMLPDAPVVAAYRLEEPDNYYYSRHGRYRPLPAWRIEFADPEATWFDIDLATGAVVQRHTARSRVLRWLYNGLHSLDFAFLTRAGALWDITVILLCVLGTVFAGTALTVAWRRLSLKNKHLRQLYERTDVN